jgi:hypothetical protein
MTPKAMSQLQEYHDADLSLGSVSPSSGSISQLQSNTTEQSNATGPYFLHLSVYKLHANWCKPPCLSPSWEKGAAKPVKGDKNYALLEACIWDAENRVALYEFDADWAKTTSQVAFANGLCKGKGWKCQAYYDHREKAKIWEAKWDDSMSDREKSKWMASKWKEVFQIVNKRNAQHWGLSYSGHGARASGAMFEGLIYKEDAVDLLKDATKTKKASILNFGGNCAEGKWNMVQALHPFADYIFASNLLVYGVKGIPRDKVGPYIALSKKEDELNNIKVQMDKRAGILDAAKALLASRRKIWEFVKETIGRTKLKQSKSLYKSSEFPALKAYLIKRWNVLSPLKRDEVIFQTEEAMCDTQVFAKGLGGDEADKLFKAFRIGYIDTSDFFKWDVPTRGLSFNFWASNSHHVISKFSELVETCKIARYSRHLFPRLVQQSAATATDKVR